METGRFVLESGSVRDAVLASIAEVEKRHHKRPDRIFAVRSIFNQLELADDETQFDGIPLKVCETPDGVTFAAMMESSEGYLVIALCKCSRD